MKDEYDVGRFAEHVVDEIQQGSQHVWATSDVWRLATSLLQLAELWQESQIRVAELESELEKRPAPVRTFGMNVRLSGLIHQPNGGTTYIALAEFAVDPRQPSMVAKLEVPLNFLGYEVAVDTVPHRSRAEVVLAEHIVNSVPDDVWDACLAALDVDAHDTVAQILETWRRG